jgi:ribosome-associated protein
MTAKRSAGIRVNARLTIPERELTLEAVRSGGPGGQNVNKVSTKVVLRFSVHDSLVLGEWRRAALLDRLATRLTKSGELVLHASRFRERHRNEEDARERLARLLEKALQTPKKRVPTRPTRGSRERRLAEKRRRSDRKRDRREPGDS